jgi:hypothetical protein
LGWAGFAHLMQESGAPLSSSTSAGAGFFNVMRLYPEESLGMVMMGNTTSYDHESILAAIVGVPWK